MISAYLEILIGCFMNMVGTRVRFSESGYQNSSLGMGSGHANYLKLLKKGCENTHVLALYELGSGRGNYLPIELGSGRGNYLKLLKNKRKSTLI